MRTLINGTWKPLLVKVPGKKPVIIGGVETVFPPRAILMPSREPMPMDDKDADFVLERYGREGVLEANPDVPIAEAILEAKTKRGQYLQGFIDHFREMNALRRAQNNDILLPRQVHREALRELNVLRKEIAAEDAELLGALIPPKREEDYTGPELAAFGVTAETMPLTPNVPAGLSDIEGL